MLGELHGTYGILDVVLKVDGADIAWPAYTALRLYDVLCMPAPAHGKAIYIWIGATSMDDPWGQARIPYIRT